MRQLASEVVGGNHEHPAKVSDLVTLLSLWHRRSSTNFLSGNSSPKRAKIQNVANKVIPYQAVPLAATYYIVCVDITLSLPSAAISTARYISLSL